MPDLSGNSVDKFVDKYGHPLKPQSERIKETVTVLKKLKDLGVRSNDYGYIQIKQHLDEWIQGGDKWSGIIDFSFYDQKVEMDIPTKPGKELMVKLLAPKVKPRF
jgi:hypothetical protein